MKLYLFSGFVILAALSGHSMSKRILRFK